MAEIFKSSRSHSKTGETHIHVQPRGEVKREILLHPSQPKGSYTADGARLFSEMDNESI